MADDDLRALAGQIADFEHDILPAHERGAERVAAYRIPPPQPVPPWWQRWLYWASLWRLRAAFRDWAVWEQTHSPDYSAVRLLASLLLLGAISAVGLLMLTGATRAWLGFYVALTLLRYVGTGLSRIDGPGWRRRQILVADTATSSIALGLRNAARISIFLCILVLPLLVLHA